MNLHQQDTETSGLLVSDQSYQHDQDGDMMDREPNANNEESSRPGIYILLVATAVAALLVLAGGGASSSSSTTASDMPLLGSPHHKKKEVVKCKDLLLGVAKVENVVFGSSPGGLPPTGSMATFTLAVTEDGDYYLYASPSAAFGGHKFLEYGTVDAPGDNEEFSEEKPCSFTFHQNTYDPDSDSYVRESITTNMNSWDGGSSVLYFAEQGVRTDQPERTPFASVMLPFASKHDCRKAIADLIDQFAQIDVSVDPGVRSLCK